MIKQVAVYRDEEGYRSWKIVDAGDRRIFADGIFLTREDAGNALAEILIPMHKGLHKRKK